MAVTGSKDIAKAFRECQNRRMRLVAFVALVCCSGLGSSETVRHRVGFRYDLPEGWTVSARQATMAVLARPGQTADELYVVSADGKGAAESVADPAFVLRDDAMFQSLNEAWQHAGTADAGQGVRLGVWRIVSEGVPLEGRLYSRLVGRVRVVVAGIATSETLNARHEELMGMALSASIEGGLGLDKDGEEAVTKWHAALSGRSLSADSNSDSSSSNGSGFSQSSTTYGFSADGRFARSVKSFVSVGGGEFGGSSESEDTVKGLWWLNIDEDGLFLLLEHEDGTMEALSLGVSGESVLVDGRAFSLGGGHEPIRFLGSR